MFFTGLISEVCNFGHEFWFQHLKYDRYKTYTTVKVASEEPVYPGLVLNYILVMKSGINVFTSCKLNNYRFDHINMFHSPTAKATPLTHWRWVMPHYKDVIMSATASQFTSLTIVYSTVYSKHHSPASLESPSLWPTEKGWNQNFRWRHSYLSQYLYSVLFWLPNIMTTAHTDVHIILTDISPWYVLKLVTILCFSIFSDWYVSLAAAISTSP